MRDGWAYDPLDDEPCAACGHIFGDHRDDDRTCGHWDSDMGTVCSCTGFEPNNRHGGGCVSGSDPRPAREVIAEFAERVDGSAPIHQSGWLNYADTALAALEAEGWRLVRDDEETGFDTIEHAAADAIKSHLGVTVDGDDLRHALYAYGLAVASRREDPQ